MKDFKQDGVQYRDGKPDFSPFTARDKNGQPIEARISNMKGDRRGADGDFGQARDAMAEKYNGWNASKMEDGYSWHHNEDTSTMQLVDRRIHGTKYGGGAHSGGASAVKDPDY
ncbi:HNH endonuclease [Agrobacterium rubi]|uniref:Uncharacterized protein n=1 Tax=Agrobacterium rubi TaxID=28099 RepID=A0AAE7UT22_9HYPH|nr:HNH endonuclease [Agrobacterium rubi]NTE90140.1 hypothetical protein [Agrobacterium rubi]NTF04866.1 hypothetical protein [Agrobacterium rubi]NTF39427.1 hypothetical protein [Agrobacterium rubi]QTG03237.1 hypothetical protein G6M88_22145 [Agrobacterium rubi]